jgi:pilus assembly protein Flp/PilA
MVGSFTTLPTIRSTNMKQLAKKFLNEETGQDLIEYALVSAVIALGSIAAIGGLTNPIVNGFNTVTNNFINDV